MLVMVMHAVMSEARQVAKMQEGVALKLLFQRGDRLLGVVVSRADYCFPRQSRGQPFQRMKHLFRITASQITAAAAEHKKRIAGDQLIANMITG